MLMSGIKFIDEALNTKIGISIKRKCLTLYFIYFEFLVKIIHFVGGVEI